MKTAKQPMPYTATRAKILRRYRWLSPRLFYLPCVSNGVRAIPKYCSKPSMCDVSAYPPRLLFQTVYPEVSAAPLSLVFREEGSLMPHEWTLVCLPSRPRLWFVRFPVNGRDKNTSDTSCPMYVHKVLLCFALLWLYHNTVKPLI